MAGTKRRRIKAKSNHAPSITRLRGFEIASRPGQIRRLDPWRFLVKSQSNSRWYNVSWNKKFWMCTCPFNRRTHSTCKHIYAIQYTLGASEPNGLIHEETDEATCPKCGSSTHIIRRGVRRNRTGPVQRYLCNHCKTLFTSRTSFRKMKHKEMTVALTLDLYYKGLSARKIADHLENFYSIKISYVTVFRWTRKYAALMKKYLDRIVPQVGAKWHADEAQVNIKGNSNHLWNLMDRSTRFLLAAKLTKQKRIANAESLLKSGIKRAMKNPRQIVTDGLPAYRKAASNLSCGKKRINHIRAPRLVDPGSNNIVERLNETFRERNKTMRSFSNNKSAAAFIDGFRIYYNFFRPHLALNGKTPAEAAKIQLPRSKNRWLAMMKMSVDQTRKK